MPIQYGGIKPKALVYSKMLQKYRNLFSYYLTFSSLTFSSKTIQTIDLAYVKIFERYFSHHHPDDGRGISQNVAHVNILVHDVINLLYYNWFSFKKNVKISTDLEVYSEPNQPY